MDGEEPAGWTELYIMRNLSTGDTNEDIPITVGFVLALKVY